MHAAVIEVNLGKVIFAHIAAGLGDLFMEGGALSVQLEEVTSGVAANGGHVAGLITNQTAKLIKV